LNGFVGEFMILIGVFDSQHFAWASWAATGAILSAVYLLWAYQRVALEKITVAKNETLPDASARERFILITASVVILFMGIFSPMFTHRMDATTNALLEQMRTTASYQAQSWQTQVASRTSTMKPTAHEVAMRSVSLERQAQP
ncbi:MAG: hypothetical protein WBD21_00665, partial [Candidatus Acidiferrales bacterium]